MKRRINKQNQLTRLEKLFDEHIGLTFPREAPTRALQNMKGELALYGGHVAGLVSSYLKNAPINKKLVKVDLNLEHQIQNFLPKTSKEKKYIQDFVYYKHKLDELIRCLVKLLSDSKEKN